MKVGLAIVAPLLAAAGLAATGHRTLAAIFAAVVVNALLMRLTPSPFPAPTPDTRPLTPDTRSPSPDTSP